MGLSWKSGDLNTMVFDMKLRATALNGEVEKAVLLSAHEGADSMQEIIIKAETETGRRRAASGGAPGRIRTGDMFNDVKSSVAEEGNTVVGKFGWPVPQDYYATQDNTAYSISGTMHSLLQSFVKSREALIGRMAQIARNGKMDQ